MEHSQLKAGQPEKQTVNKLSTVKQKGTNSKWQPKKQPSNKKDKEESSDKKPCARGHYSGHEVKKHQAREADDYEEDEAEFLATCQQHLHGSSPHFHDCHRLWSCYPTGTTTVPQLTARQKAWASNSGPAHYNDSVSTRPLVNTWHNKNSPVPPLEAHLCMKSTSRLETHLPMSTCPDWRTTCAPLKLPSLLMWKWKKRRQLQAGPTSHYPCCWPLLLRRLAMKIWISLGSDVGMTRKPSGDSVNKHLSLDMMDLIVFRTFNEFGVQTGQFFISKLHTWY